MRIVGLILMVVFAFGVYVGIVKLNEIIDFLFNDNPNDKSGAIIMRFLGGVVAILIVTMGVLDFYGMLAQKQNITVHFEDTNTTVCYEDAQLLYGKNGDRTVITNDGHRIQIVNATIDVEEVDTNA